MQGEKPMNLAANRRARTVQEPSDNTVSTHPVLLTRTRDSRHSMTTSSAYRFPDASVPLAPDRSSDAVPIRRGGPPVHVRAVGVELGDDEREYIGQKLAMKLAKFGTMVERASVRVEDVNGPRGGVDKVCRVKVVLFGLPTVVVEQADEAQHAAVDGAMGRTDIAVARSLARRRMKPLHGRGSRL
jgi:putative sigma-54 modulation protein